MTLAGQAGQSPKIPFRVEKSELNVQLNFASPYWPLAQNISGLYAGLLKRMAEFGVTSQALRPDVADGSLGAFNVNFWMLQFGVIVRIRLDSVELNAPNFAIDANQLERAFVALDQSLRDVQPDLKYSTSTVTILMHGRVDGFEPKQFLERFSNSRPEGLGSFLGSGTVFYFEGRPPLTLLSVTADLSTAVAGGISVRVHSVFDDSIRPDALRAAAEEQLVLGVQGLGLDFPDPAAK